LVAIDYFSRKVWATATKTKEAKKTIKFLSKIKENIKIKTIVTDNGREFSNERVKNWCLENNVNHEFSIPYYHQSNGRVERVNRTLRDACRKVQGSTKKKLRKIVDAYNKTTHRGIGMAPDEALKEENYNRVVENVERYKKEFLGKNRGIVKLKVGQKVLIKNEERLGKMDDEFREEGVVIENVYGDIYKIRIGRNDKFKFIKRHISQLKPFEGREV
jgi:predicted nuclease of restriction endonuclease-like RecB superfamily